MSTTLTERKNSGEWTLALQPEHPGGNMGIYQGNSITHSEQRRERQDNCPSKSGMEPGKSLHHREQWVSNSPQGFTLLPWTFASLDSGSVRCSHLTEKQQTVFYMSPQPCYASLGSGSLLGSPATPQLGSQASSSSVLFWDRGHRRSKQATIFAALQPLLLLP